MSELTKEYFEKEIGQLGSMIKKGFDDMDEKLETNIHRVETKVDKALQVEYVNLEVRVKRIENKLGLKPIT